MSVLIFHPSAANFVQQAARSLHEAGQLDRFITSVRDDPRNPTQRLACLAGRLAGRDLEKRFHRRAITEIPLAKVETARPWGELLRLAVGSVDRVGRLTDMIWERAERGFDRAVARRLHSGLTGVYGFEFSSLATFRRARVLGLKVIYEVPGPETRFVQGLLAAEMEKFPELRTAYHRHTAAREEERTARRRAEWQTADLIIASSSFTRDSYARAGMDVSKVRVVRLGAPAPAARREAIGAHNRTDGPLQFLWAGTFGIRKGAHHLLQAWKQGDYGRHARLLVFGSVGLPDRVLHPLPSGIELCGSVPRAELMEHYRRADALIFPTLCDGFGMVVNEAWSCGLPVIATERAGVSESLQPGVNGLCIRAGDADAIAAAIDWCLTHRNELRAMREAALATAGAWQWSDFRRAHAAALKEAGVWSDL